MPKMTKKVPKGTSEYQAAWIVDKDDDEENGEEEDSSEDESDEEMEESDTELQPREEVPESGDDADELASLETMSQAESFGNINMEIDMEEVEKYRQERENEQWPDEVETPRDVAARIRFQKYRGLKSFRWVLIDYCVAYS